MARTTIRRKSDAYFALIAATLALAINFWAWSLISPLGIKYAEELKLSPSALSLLLALPVLIGALGRIPLGLLTDRYGGKIMFAVVCFLTAIPTIGLAFSDSHLSLVFMAVLLGLGGASFTIGVPYISAWFPPRQQGIALGIYSLGNIGTAISAFMTPRLADLIGRNETFFMVATLLIIGSLVFSIWAKNSPSWHKPSNTVKQRILFATSQRLTWDLSTVYIITFGALVAFGVYLPTLLKISYDLSLTDAASKAAGFVLLAALARPLGGWLSDKFGGRKVIRISLILIAVLASVVALQTSLTIHTTTAYLSLAVVLGAANGAVFAMIGRLAKPGTVGGVSGIVGAIGGLGGFLPPLFLGITYQATRSYSLALIALTVCTVIVFIYISRRFTDISVYRKTA